ncbi:MAG TPA: hypothetical protein VMU51_36200 [Mycobacteriales bacterium]|nr:hypothetical protein [Mycobacteriales bacterium]
MRKLRRRLLTGVVPLVAVPVLLLAGVVPASAHTVTVFNGYTPTVYAGPGTSYAVTGRLSSGQQVAIACTRTGSSVTGPFGATTVWDYTHLETGYVSDAFINTGQAGAVGPTCGGAEFHYDYAAMNLHVNQPGLVRLYQEISSNPGYNPGNQNRNLGIYANKPLLHMEGRALDYRMNAFDNNPTAMTGEYWTGWNLATYLHDNAAAYGIQEIIWDDWAWDVRHPNAAWTPYDESTCVNSGGAVNTCRHMDHLHIGMNWAGAVLQTRHWGPPR